VLAAEKKNWDAPEYKKPSLIWPKYSRGKVAEIIDPPKYLATLRMGLHQKTRDAEPGPLFYGSTEFGSTSNANKT